MSRHTTTPTTTTTDKTMTIATHEARRLNDAADKADRDAWTASEAGDDDRAEDLWALADDIRREIANDSANRTEDIQALAIRVARSNFEAALDQDPTESGFSDYQRNVYDTLSEQSGLAGEDLWTCSCLASAEWKRLLADHDLPADWV